VATWPPKREDIRERLHILNLSSLLWRGNALVEVELAAGAPSINHELALTGADDSPDPIMVRQR
jgi:hypothetical protein